MAERCQRCGTLLAPNRRANHAFCGGCERRLLREGLCKWCGARPRHANPGTGRKAEACAECAAAFVAAAHNQPLPKMEAVPDVAPPKYRGSDARENIRETRGD